MSPVKKLLASMADFGKIKEKSFVCLFCFFNFSGDHILPVSHAISLYFKQQG